MSSCRPTVAAIDLRACVANLSSLRDRIGRKDVWAVVKADAYGHGAVPVARSLASSRVAGFGVATPSEGRELRRAGIDVPILVMTGPPSGGADDGFEMAVEYGLSSAIGDLQSAENLAAAAGRLGIGPAVVHIKVDTGMGRIGALPDATPALARAVSDHAWLSLEGIFSTLACADSVDDGAPGFDFTRQQIELFREVCLALREDGMLPKHRTLANSSAISHWPYSWEDELFSGVRPGLALFGASLTPGRDPIELRPAMRFSSRIQTVRELPVGVPVGYGMSFTTWRTTRVGVVPVGYHDGLPRALGNRGWVSIRNRRAPIIGRISMDTTLVDVTELSAARADDEVVLFGAAADSDSGLGDQSSREHGYAATLAAALAAVDEVEPDAALGQAGSGRGPICAEEVADWAGTIPHELLCRIGARTPRVYCDGDGVVRSGEVAS